MWGRRDDHAWMNEKLVALSHEAFRLYEVALSFCAMEWPAGAGRISPERAASLAGFHRIANPDNAITELVEHRCWHRTARMYSIHDFPKYMAPSDLSEKRSRAGARGAKARWANRGEMANANGKPDGNASQTHSKGSPEPESEPDSSLHSESQPPTPFVTEIFQLWKAETGRNGQHKLTPKRRKVITARLRDYSEEDIREAVLGVRFDPWSERAQHNDLTQILKDSEHVEKFRDLYWRRDEKPPLANLHDRDMAAIFEGRA